MTNAFFDPGHIDLFVLILGLFLPRLALFIAWFGFLPYPPNALPNIINAVMWLFLPRFLMAYYVYTDNGTNNIWFWAYLVLGFVGLMGESGYVRRRVVRKTTVIRDGHRTTTIEEEV